MDCFGRGWRLVWALLLVQAGSLLGQSPERIRPTFEPRRITGDPALLLSKLQSEGTLREEALGTLQLDVPWSVLRARLVPVQLDEDSGMEAILEIDFGMVSYRCVFKETAAGWLFLGDVGASAPFGENFELRRIASPKWPDLVVRNHGMPCGGGYCASSVSVYHLV